MAPDRCRLTMLAEEPPFVVDAWPAGDLVVVFTVNDTQYRIVRMTRDLSTVVSSVIISGLPVNTWDVEWKLDVRPFIIGNIIYLKQKNANRDYLGFNITSGVHTGTLTFPLSFNPKGLLDTKTHLFYPSADNKLVSTLKAALTSEANTFSGVSIDSRSALFWLEQDLSLAVADDAPTALTLRLTGEDGATGGYYGGLQGLRQGFSMLPVNSPLFNTLKTGHIAVAPGNGGIGIGLLDTKNTSVGFTSTAQLTDQALAALTGSSNRTFVFGCATNGDHFYFGDSYTPFYGGKALFALDGNGNLVYSATTINGFKPTRDPAIAFMWE